VIAIWRARAFSDSKRYPLDGERGERPIKVRVRRRLGREVGAVGLREDKPPWLENKPSPVR